ncbi:MAG: hypothetical protein AAFY55_06415 [Bacteroidota bacterium]
MARALRRSTLTAAAQTVVLRFGKKILVVFPADPDAFKAGLTALESV